MLVDHVDLTGVSFVLWVSLALQTLKCRPGNRNNLNALLFMTRTGRLRSLTQLILIELLKDLQMQVTSPKRIYRSLDYRVSY